MALPVNRVLIANRVRIPNVTRGGLRTQTLLLLQLQLQQPLGRMAGLRPPPSRRRCGRAASVGSSQRYIPIPVALYATVCEFSACCLQAAAAAWATRAGGSAWARGSVPAPAAAHSGPSTAGGPRDGTGRAFSSEDAADGGLSGSPEKGHGSGAQEPLQPHRNLYQQQPQPNTASAWWSTRPGGMGPTAGSPIAGEPAANPQKRRTRGSEQLEAPRNGRKGGAKPEDAAAVMAGTSAASVADAATAGAKRSRVTAAAAAQHSGRRRAVTEEPLDRGGTDASERSSLEAGQGDEAGEQVGRSHVCNPGTQ